MGVVWEDRYQFTPTEWRSLNLGTSKGQTFGKYHYRVKDAGRVIALARSKAETIEEEAWHITENSWPKTEMPVLYQGVKRTLGTMRWGVWPSYKLDPFKPGLLINARDEVLTLKTVWGKSVARGRCLVPADGFYKRTGLNGKVWEALFHLRNEAPFFIAGLWSEDPLGHERGFALVTSKPTGLLAARPHSSLPVILDDARAEAWIGNQPLTNERLLRLCGSPYLAAEIIITDEPDGSQR